MSLRPAASLQNLALGLRFDATRHAILREAGHAAELWQRKVRQRRCFVVDVLAAEARLARQLGALSMLADDRLLRHLLAQLADTTAGQGDAFIAGFVLLQAKGRPHEQAVFTRWWDSQAPAHHFGLGWALAVCGVVAAASVAKLAQAMSSQDAPCVQRAAALATRLVGIKSWPVPNVRHAAGLCAALRLMGRGNLQPAPEVLRRASGHAAPQVRAACRSAQQKLFARAALEACRAAAHRGRDHSHDCLRLLGLLHDPHEARVAARDLGLLQDLCRQRQTAAAAVEALGLMGRPEARWACLQAAQAQAELVGPVARSLQAIFGLDDEFTGAFADTDGPVTVTVLDTALRAHLTTAPTAEAAGFVPRSLESLRVRLRCCDMGHLRDRADECLMRSQGRVQLRPWAFITPQIGPTAPLWRQAAAMQAVAARPAAAMPQGGLYG